MNHSSTTSQVHSEKLESLTNGPERLKDSRLRIGLLLAGLLSLAIAWLGPLPHLAHEAFFAHMLMHMLVVAIAAPLLSLAIAGTNLDPVIILPKLFAPIPASVVELIIVWAWHAPGLHHVARMTTWGLFAEQGSFLIAGLAVWLSAFGGPVPRSGARSAAGVIGLLLTSMHMTLLGALLALAPRSVYAHHQGYGGMTALEDQHLGGAVMLIIGGLAYLSGGVWLSVGLVREHKQKKETQS